jgi:hypothetical protein
MSISGFLNLGTALSGTVIVPPPSGAGYAPQPISFNSAAGGVTLNGVSCVFGPVTAPWGTLTSFNVTDTEGNPYWAGTLAVPLTPVTGQLVVVPQGNITLVVGAQFTVAPSAPVVKQGSTTSGSVTLSSGAYSMVLASGARNMILLTETSGFPVRIVLGGSLPPSGATGYSLIPPNGTWPPSSMADFVPTDEIWALGTAGSQELNYITG